MAMTEMLKLRSVMYMLSSSSPTLPRLALPWSPMSSNTNSGDPMRSFLRTISFCISMTSVTRVRSGSSLNSSTSTLSGSPAQCSFSVPVTISTKSSRGSSASSRRRMYVVLPPPEPAATMTRMGKPPISTTSSGVMKGMARRYLGAGVAEGGGVGDRLRSLSSTELPSSSST